MENSNLQSKYFPQIEISGKDVADFAKRGCHLKREDMSARDLENIFKFSKDGSYTVSKKFEKSLKDLSKSKFKDVTDPGGFLTLYKLINCYPNSTTREDFLDSVNNTLRKYDLGEKDLLYAFPDSEGNLVVDGNKYKNIGSADHRFIDRDSAVRISIFYILRGRLKKRSDSLKFLKKINFMQFFAGIPSVINETCKKLTLTDGVEKIAPNACEYCSHLTQLSLPTTLKSIGEEAFQDCHSLGSIKIPGSVKTIGDSAFKYCINLKHVDIQQGVNTIGDYAFDKCNLQNINIPKSVEKVGKMAFSDNPCLKDEKTKDGTVTYVLKTKDMKETKVPEEKVKEL